MTTNHDAWWPEGLDDWITVQAKTDPLFAAINTGLRTFGWPDYNVPQPLPREDTWPGLTLALAQRLREANSHSETSA